MKRIVFIVFLLLMSVLNSGFSVTKEQRHAQRFVKHQHLLIQAIREILEEDPERYCKDLSSQDCRQAKRDQKELLDIMERVADHNKGEGKF